MRLASLGVPRGQSSRGSTRHLAFRRLRSSGCCRIRSCPQWCGPRSWNMSRTKPLGGTATRDSSCAGFRLGSMGLFCPAPPFATRIRSNSTRLQQFPLPLTVNRVGRLNRRHHKSGIKDYDCPIQDTNLVGTLGLKDLVSMAASTPGLEELKGGAKSVFGRHRAVLRAYRLRVRAAEGQGRRTSKWAEVACVF